MVAGLLRRGMRPEGDRGVSRVGEPQGKGWPPRVGWGHRVGRMVGKWGVVNHVRRRDRLRSRCETPPHTARASGLLVLAGGNPSGMRGYLGVIQMDPGEDRELTILQEPRMEKNLQKEQMCVYV